MCVAASGISSTAKSASDVSPRTRHRLAPALMCVDRTRDSFSLAAMTNMGRPRGKGDSKCDTASARFSPLPCHLRAESGVQKQWLSSSHGICSGKSVSLRPTPNSTRSFASAQKLPRGRPAQKRHRRLPLRPPEVQLASQPLSVWQLVALPHWAAPRAILSLSAIHSSGGHGRRRLHVANWLSMRGGIQSVVLLLQTPQQSYFGR